MQVTLDNLKIFRNALYPSSKAKLYNNVALMRLRLGIRNSDYPLNVPNIANSIKSLIVEYREFKTRGIGGAYFKGYPKSLICLNSARSEIEQNHDCGHELIHHFWHRSTFEDCYTIFEKGIVQDGYQEWQANEGGAEFIMPCHLVIPEAAMFLDNFPTYDHAYII